MDPVILTLGDDKIEAGVPGDGALILDIMHLYSRNQLRALACALAVTVAAGKPCKGSKRLRLPSPTAPEYGYDFGRAGGAIMRALEEADLGLLDWQDAATSAFVLLSKHAPELRKRDIKATEDFSEVEDHSEP